MASTESIPSIDQMLNAANAELWARRQTADEHSGSVYNVHAGVGGLLWIREANRDRAAFRKCYFDTCENSDLDWRVYSFGGPPRVDATKGTGTALLSRTTAAGGLGVFWKGTRIAIAGLGQIPRYFRVAADTIVDAVSLGVVIPIEAEEAGSGCAVNSSALNAPRMYLEDPVWDPSWKVLALQCTDGTDRETDAEYRARWRQSKLDQRPGYRKAISDALVEQGAANIALFESDFIASTDNGVNRCFVADASWQSPEDLLNRCRLALESVRVAGCDLTVWGITRTPASFDITAHTWDKPGTVNQSAVGEAVRDGVLHHFSARDNAFVFSRDGLTGDVLQSCPLLQSIDFGSSDPVDTVLTTVLESAALPLLYTSRPLISVAIAGPV